MSPAIESRILLASVTKFPGSGGACTRHALVAGWLNARGAPYAHQAVTRWNDTVSHLRPATWKKFPNPRVGEPQLAGQYGPAIAQSISYLQLHE